MKWGVFPSPIVCIGLASSRTKEAFVSVGRPTERSSFFWPCREVKLYRMLVREVGELLRSIDSPSISNPSENRSESLPAWLVVVVFFLAYVVVGLPTRTRPPECLLGSGQSQKPIHTIGEGKTPHFIAPGERKFDRGLERRGGRKGSGWI